MARRRKRDVKSVGSYHRGFQDSDLRWLATKFQEQSARDPDLTLEAFAISYGVQPNLLRNFLGRAGETHPAVEAMVKQAARKPRKWLPIRERRRQLAQKTRKRKRPVTRASDWMVYTSLNFGWLAKEFQRQTENCPDLTLKAFANHHGLVPEWIERFIDRSQNRIPLWHGTTADRARAIMEQGFQPPNTGKVWFAKTSELPYRMAMRRAEKRRQMPVVLCCEIDLDKYPPFERAAFAYVFSSGIGSEVIQGISIAKNDGFARYTKDLADLPCVKLDGTSGRADVLAWINLYLQVGREAPISEDHPAVDAVLKWLRAQYMNGRDNPISEDELFSLVTLIRSVPGMGVVKDAALQVDDDEHKLVDVVVTKNAGKLGVHWWLEQYLELIGKAPVGEDHPAVDAIFAWVEAQYVAGRETPISDGEMLMKVTEVYN